MKLWNWLTEDYTVVRSRLMELLLWLALASWFLRSTAEFIGWLV